MRKAFLNIHLAACIVAGIFIGLLCLTGVAISFKQEIVAWSERDVRHAGIPRVDEGRLMLAGLADRATSALPGGARSVILENRLDAAVAFVADNNDVFYVDPCIKDAVKSGSNRVRALMQTMTELHRWLGLKGQYRPVGKFVNGVCNVAMLALTLSGLYLWWTGRWTWCRLKAVAVLNQRLKGRARNFNLHNVIGLWTAPILILITVTAIPISFCFADSLITLMVGEKSPQVVRRVQLQQPLTAEDFYGGLVEVAVSNVVRDYPRWRQIVISRYIVAKDNMRPAILEIAVHENRWPRTPPVIFTIDGLNGQILKKTDYTDMGLARRMRYWERSLHSGRAFGWLGQLVAAIGAFGGLLLLYTGISIAGRRLKCK